MRYGVKFSFAKNPYSLGLAEWRWFSSADSRSRWLAEHQSSRGFHVERIVDEPDRIVSEAAGIAAPYRYDGSTDAAILGMRY